MREDTCRVGTIIASVRGRQPTIPARDIKAQRELGGDEFIVIAQVDKVGSFVIIDNTGYVAKVEVVLSDDSTYKKSR